MADFRDKECKDPDGLHLPGKHQNVVTTQ